MNEIILYKFRTIGKNLIHTLVKGELYFANPNSLNDPFDCQVDIKKAAENAISRLSGEKKEKLEQLVKISDFLDRIQKIQKGTGDVGICSFSSVLDESLLWSHYANEHKGLCLTYMIPGEFLWDPSNRIVGACRVDYGKNPLTEWFMENTPENPESVSKNFEVDIVNKALSIKGEGWGYEKEVRLIREQEGQFAVPMEFLKQVCFGMNTSESDISLIRQLINNAGYSVEYYQIERSDQDFGIKATILK